MSDNKMLIVKKEGIFKFITKFFRKLFLTKKEEEITNNVKVIKEMDFKEFNKNIKTEEVIERQRLLEMQNKIRNKSLTEKDISEDDINLLRELYNNQIQDLKKSILNCRIEIEKIKQT